MRNRLFQLATLAMIAAATLIWRQILLAKDDAPAEPSQPPADGAFTFPATYITCVPDHVAAVVSVRGGNKITCAPLNRE